MDVLLIVLGVLGSVLGFFIINEGTSTNTIVKIIVVSITLMVLGSWMDDWFCDTKLIEHHNVSSLPVDGGQLEFFDPVDVLETRKEYPWFISQDVSSEFEVVGGQ